MPELNQKNNRFFTLKTELDGLKNQTEQAIQFGLIRLVFIHPTSQLGLGPKRIGIRSVLFFSIGP